MKRTCTLIASGLVVTVLAVAMPLSASASAMNPSLDDAVAQALGAELEHLARTSVGVVSFSEVTVDVSTELVLAAGSTDPTDIAEFILAESEAASRGIDTETTDAVPSAPASPLQPFAMAAAAKKTVNYTADQNTTLPSFGIAWVNQDMTVTFTGNTINSVTLKGASYGTGISLFAYSHTNTSLEYRLNRTCLYTKMKGTFSAVVKGSAVSFAATVLATDAPRNGKMVSRLYSDC